MNGPWSSWSGGVTAAPSSTLPTSYGSSSSSHRCWLPIAIAPIRPPISIVQPCSLLPKGPCQPPNSPPNRPCDGQPHMPILRRRRPVLHAPDVRRAWHTPRCQMQAAQDGRYGGRHPPPLPERGRVRCSVLHPRELRLHRTRRHPQALSGAALQGSTMYTLIRL